MIRLSVNINKVATVRNARGGAIPSVVAAAEVCVHAGAPGITVHPRKDARHITFRDVHDLTAMLAPHRKRVEFNIEGDPRPDLLALVRQVRPDQCTLVPVAHGEITSQAGWPENTDAAAMRKVVTDLRAQGIRSSLFIDSELAAVDWAADLGADRVELFTEPFARAAEAGGDVLKRSLEQYVSAAGRAHDRGLDVNAGHDLDLQNLPIFKQVPHVVEVSIGHALVSRALFVGLDRVVHEYLAILEGEVS